MTGIIEHAERFTKTSIKKAVFDGEISKNTNIGNESVIL